MGTFTVKGTVAGTSLQPSAQVTVAEAVAAQNMSGAIVEGYSAVLPNTTTVYYSDGVTEEAGIRWKEEPEGTDPKVYEGEVEGTQLTVTYTVVWQMRQKPAIIM